MDFWWVIMIAAGITFCGLFTGCVVAVGPPVVEGAPCGAVVRNCTCDPAPYRTFSGETYADDYCGVGYDAVVYCRDGYGQAIRCQDPENGLGGYAWARMCGC